MIYGPRNRAEGKNEDRALCRGGGEPVRRATCIRTHTQRRAHVRVACTQRGENSSDKFALSSPFFFFFLFSLRAHLGIYCFNLPWPCLIMESSFRLATACQRPGRLSRRFCVFTHRQRVWESLSRESFADRVRCDVVTALPRETVSPPSRRQITLFLTQRWHRAPRKHAPTFATWFQTLL